MFNQLLLRLLLLLLLLLHLAFQWSSMKIHLFYPCTLNFCALIADADDGDDYNDNDDADNAEEYLKEYPAGNANPDRKHMRMR